MVTPKAPQQPSASPSISKLGPLTKEPSEGLTPERADALGAPCPTASLICVAASVLSWRLLWYASWIHVIHIIALFGMALREFFVEFRPSRTHRLPTVLESCAEIRQIEIPASGFLLRNL